MIIYKYRIRPDAGSTPVEMPQGATVLSAGVDRWDCLCVWALVDPAAPVEKHLIHVYPTGVETIEPVGRCLGVVFLGYEPNPASVVVHVFDRAENP